MRADGLRREGARAITVSAWVLLASCGGSSSGPTPTPSVSPSPVGGSTVTAIVFYDENGDGAMQGPETVRLSQVQVDLGGRSGRSDAAGRALIAHVPAGAHAASVRPETLPPFFVQSAPVSVNEPGTGEFLFPVTLPIRNNIPYMHLISGDSIAQGTGSADMLGFRQKLRTKLEQHYGGAVNTYYRGGGGGTSRDAVGLLPRHLSSAQPAYSLLAWGTNDWHVCADAQESCGLVANIRTLIQQAKNQGSLPCVASILPTNPAISATPPSPRNAWVVGVNTQIQAVAREEGALYVDTHAAFTRHPNPSSLLADEVHPNDAGYDVLAQAWFDALTLPRSTTTGQGGF